MPRSNRLLALFKTWTMSSEIGVIIDIPYGIQNHSLHKWDLFYPRSDTDAKPLPIIIFVHGGAWRRYYNIYTSSELYLTSLSSSGDKSEHHTLARNLVEATGFAVAIPNYRLSPQKATPTEPPFRHPGHVDDIVSALITIHSWEPPSTVDLRLDYSALHLIGHSCGAHMVGTILMKARAPEAGPTQPLPETIWSAIQTATIAEGIYDLDLLLIMFPNYQDFVEGGFGERVVQSGSSLTKFSVTQFDVPENSMVRWFVVQSTGDTLVDVNQAEAMISHLEASHKAPTSRVFQDISTLKGDHDAVLQTKEFAWLVAEFVMKHG
jgi:acetyl esterase/lipase